MKREIPKIIVKKNEKVTDVMKKHSSMIVDYITEAIDEALDNKSEEIDIFYVQFEIGLPDAKFKLNKKKWPAFLNRMISESVKSENYEIAAKIKKTLEKVGDVQ